MTDYQRKQWRWALKYGGPVYPMSFADTLKHRNSLNSRKTAQCAMVDFSAAASESWWDFYGGGAVVSKRLCDRLLDDINNGAQIDWSKAGELQQDTEYEFVGTDEDAERIKIFKGVMHMTNGNSYPWVVRYDLVMIGSEIADSTDKEVLTDIQNRICKKREMFRRRI